MHADVTRDSVVAEAGEAGNLLLSVCAAIEAAGDSITPIDDGAVALAKTYAATIDEVIDSGDPMAITKALYLGPHLLNVLGVLGLTPEARKQVAGQVAEAKTGSKLAQLRAVK